MPHIGYPPAAIEKHLNLVEAIRAGDGDQAEEIMQEHVGEFYAQVHETLTATE